MKIFTLISIWQILITTSSQLAVPNDDSESLIDGYDMELPPVLQFNPEMIAREGQRLPLQNTRERRNTYHVLESKGLVSHFKINPEHVEEYLKKNDVPKRARRAVASRSELHSDEVEDVESESRKLGDGDNISVESVPPPQKQASNPAYYRSSDDSRLMDKWVKSPYGDYQSKSAKDDDDTHSEASSNVGNKARTPRVNFITQQGQTSSTKDDYDGPEAREKERERERERERDRDNNRDRDNRDQAKPNTDDTYRKPLYDRPSSSPGYSHGYKDYNYNSPNYINPYDRYQPYDRYHPSTYYNRDRDYAYQGGYQNPYQTPYYGPYERDYLYGERAPNGMSRMVPPNNPSSAFYYRHQYNDYDEYFPRSIPNYYYSDKRFDIPPTGMEPREYYDRASEVNRPGRIIYYANLPEVVRTPNNYRSATARYGDPMYNNYNDGYRSFREAKSVPLGYRGDLPPSSTTMRVSSTVRNRGGYYKK